MTETTTQEATQDQQIDVKAMQAELERLRTHSAELLSDLKAERKAHNQTKSELQGALGGESATWKERYQQKAINEPLMREIQAAAGVPAKYLQDICMEMGVLKMVEDDEGLTQPQWLNLDGEPADMKQGLHMFLYRLCDKDESGLLGHAVRGLGASGYGMSTSSTSSTTSYSVQQPVEPPAPAPKMAVGLR